MNNILIYVVLLMWLITISVLTFDINRSEQPEVLINETIFEHGINSSEQLEVLMDETIFEQNQLFYATANETIENFRNSMQKELLSLVNLDCEKNFEYIARSIIALSLGTEAFFRSNNIMGRLIRKQLHFEIALILAEKQENNISRKLVHHVHALLAICDDPHNFQNFNLIEKLKQMQTFTDYEEALKILVLCNAGYHLSKNNILTLIKILQNNSSVLYNADTSAMAVMALACDRQSFRNTFVNFNLRESLKSLKKLQNTDGSFGNIYTTALIVQALIAVGDLNQNWSYHQAINYIKSEFEKNKFQFSFSAYYFILPILNFKSMLHINEINCTVQNDICMMKESTRTSYRPEIFENDILLIEYNSNKFHVIVFTVSLKCDTCIFQNTTISTVVTIEDGETLLHAMEKIAGSEEVFQFSTINSEFGIFVQSISNIETDISNNRYWMIYLWNPISNTYQLTSGIANILPKNNEHYVFWYKQF